MGGIERFENIEAWKQARELAKKIYAKSNSDHFSRDFGLRDQIRRAVVSVMSNIAEGFERGGDKEFVQFLYLAKGSCGEVRCQLYIARDQDYISETEFDQLTGECIAISRMLSGFITYLQKSPFKGPKFKPPPPPP